MNHYVNLLSMCLFGFGLVLRFFFLVHYHTQKIDNQFFIILTNGEKNIYIVDFQILGISPSTEKV